MNTQTDVAASDLFEPRYVAFLDTITHLRPRLHRYCARMTGSALDGEDVMQEAVFEAYRKLDGFDDSRPLGPWLFRIAHNRCIDFLRRREVRQSAEAAAAEPDSVQPTDPLGPALDRAVERLVLNLPPKERPCVLLKDAGVDYDTDQTAISADLARARQAFETNVFGAWAMAQAVAPGMRRRRWGRIVNVSSGAGALASMERGPPGYSARATAAAPSITRRS